MTNVIQATAPLKATSNVIELKPDKKYLLIFKGCSVSQAQVIKLKTILANMGITGLCVTIDDDTDLEVIEVQF